MADVAELGFSVDSKPIGKASDELDNMAVASGRAESATSKLGSRSAQAGSAISRYGAMLAKAAAAAAAFGLAAAGALAALVRRTLTAVDEQAKLAASLDASIDGLRGLQIAASDAGVSAGGLTSSIEMLNRRLGEAERAGTPAYEALERLGLTAQELGALDVDERMAVLADRVQELGLSGAQAGDLLRQFGIRNSELINLMRGGGDAIRAARQEVDDFGLSISRVDAAGIERANDAMSRIGRVIEVVATRLTVALAPALEAAANWMNELSRANGGWRDMADQAAQSVVAGMLWVIDTYEKANLAAARFLLFFAETQEASARFGAAARGLFGAEATQYQQDVIAAAEAQRAFIEELEGTVPLSDRLRASLDEVRTATEAAFGEMESGGAGANAVVSSIATQAGEAANAFADLRNELAAGIQTEQAALFDASGQAEEAQAIREELELAQVIARGNGELSSQQIDYLESQLELQRELRREAEAQTEINQLRAEMRGPEESERDKLEERMELLREGLELELLTRNEFRELEMEAIAEFEQWKLDRTAETAEQRKRIEREAVLEQQAERQKELRGWASFFGNLATVAEAGGKRMFGIMKALRIAEAIANTFAGATRAYADLPWPLSIAVAASIVAAGLANVAKIASTNPGGGGGGSAVTGGGVGGTVGGERNPHTVEPVQTQTQPREITINVEGEVFTRETLAGIFEGLNDLAADGAKFRVA